MASRGVKQRNNEYKGSEYPPDWPEISRRVKDTAGRRCERCGHPDPIRTGENRYAPGQYPCDSECRHEADGKQRMLTVHHLDCNKANCANWNLAALCQVCHLSIQGRVDFEQIYLFEHSNWMKPHIEGFYASR